MHERTELRMGDFGARCLLTCSPSGAMFSPLCFLRPITSRPGWSTYAVATAMVRSLPRDCAAGFCWRVERPHRPRPVVLAARCSCGWACSSRATRDRSPVPAQLACWWRPPFPPGPSSADDRPPSWADRMSTEARPCSLVSVVVGVAPMTMSPFRRLAHHAIGLARRAADHRCAGVGAARSAARSPPPPPGRGGKLSRARPRDRSRTCATRRSLRRRRPRADLLRLPSRRTSVPDLHTVTYAMTCGLCRSPPDELQRRGPRGLGVRLGWACSLDRLVRDAVLIAGF